jgi:hypothetical protein
MTQIARSIFPEDPPPPERRLWPRHACPATSYGRVFHPGGGRTRPARVLNLCCGGLALLLEEPFERGTTLKVELEGRYGPRMLLARVAHATAQPAGWLVGCELVRPVTGTELQDLLW